MIDKPYRHQYYILYIIHNTYYNIGRERLYAHTEQDCLGKRLYFVKLAKHHDINLTVMKMGRGGGLTPPHKVG